MIILFGDSAWFKETHMGAKLTRTWDVNFGCYFGECFWMRLAFKLVNFA
jgi:hypothetical protein